MGGIVSPNFVGVLRWPRAHQEFMLNSGGGGGGIGVIAHTPIMLIDQVNQILFKLTSTAIAVSLKVLLAFLFRD